MNIRLIILIFATILPVSCREDGISKPAQPQWFSDVEINDGFWSERLEKHASVTIPVCIDQIENQTGRILNFDNAAKGEGTHSGIYFDDSDVYKALEGMAYSLVIRPDEQLENKCDEWIDKFAAAQREDGYINTYYTLTGLENRWTDMDRHEMYCAGHMTEAAVAYYKATGKRKLLDVAIKMADHMMEVFGPGKRDWVPGHEEIELALVKLYEVTAERKYLEFSNWLLEERGRGYGYCPIWEWNPEYHQDEKPVREMTDIHGHAVRAMYLYCGMADVAAYTANHGYMTALDSLWDDVVLRNMYITGGIGQSAHNEGFTQDYSLPNLTAYCETCASIGMVLWNWRMNQFTADSKYIDVLERCLYNGVLSGISLSGDSFFYVNPLESLGNHHRQPWYGCACCPSQICRFLPSIGNYIYGHSDKNIWVNLYIGSSTSFGDLTLTQDSNFPWDGDIRLTVNCSKPVRKKICLRIPDWCDSFTLSLNGRELEPATEKGYVILDRRWKDDEVISLNLDMAVKMVQADPRTLEDTGKRAVQRGPLVYCIEQCDNPDFDSISLNNDISFQKISYLDGINNVQGLQATDDSKSFILIPYYAWDNRSAGKMKVWIDFN